ncbi:MAG: InlB B-repeat-containing protein, partial [Kangiellaceae bacterium]
MSDNRLNLKKLADIISAVVAFTMNQTNFNNLSMTFLSHHHLQLMLGLVKQSLLVALISVMLLACNSEDEQDDEEEPIVQKTLILEFNGMGSVSDTANIVSCESNCNTLIDQNSSIVLNATAAIGYSFLQWNGACSGSGSCSVAMDSDKTVAAVFVEEEQEPDQFTLSLSKTGNGSISSNPGGINCGTSCSADFDSNSSITLSAEPANGYVFDRWTGACSGTAECSVTMTANKSVGVVFNEEVSVQEYTLSVNVNGSGDVTSSPGGINCGSDCSELYVENSQITLTATPNSGWIFNGWSGSCSGQTTCVVNMNASKSVTASYIEESIETHLLTVSLSGDGSVTSTPVGINCGSDCSENYEENTQVDLVATASSGYVFSAWSGACSGAGSCSISMNSTKNVTAIFEEEVLEQYELDVVVSGAGNVISSPSGIDCGSDCSQTYDEGTLISLTATADDGFKFSQWSGACSGTTTCEVTIDSAKSVSAEFVSLANFDLNVTVTGSGSVTSNPTGIDCGGDCSQSFEENTNVSITAIPDSGFKLDHWESACTGNGSCSFNMDSDKNLTAVFVEDIVPDVLIENYSPSGDAFTLGQIPKDASGITWHAGIQQYLIVQNNAARIYRYDANFAYLGSITVSGIHNDTEGLSYVEDNKVLIISEDGQASKLEIDENTTSVSGRIPTSQRYKIMAHGGNKGTEGIAVRKSSGSQLVRVYAVKEGTGGSNMRVVSFDMPDPDPGVLLDYQSNLTVNEPWNADVALAGSARDLAGAVFDERTQNLIILSQESRRAMQVDPDTGSIISTLNVSGAPQYEGVTIGPNGELVFVSE